MFDALDSVAGAELGSNGKITEVIISENYPDHYLNGDSGYPQNLFIRLVF